MTIYVGDAYVGSGIYVGDWISPAVAPVLLSVDVFYPGARVTLTFSAAGYSGILSITANGVAQSGISEDTATTASFDADIDFGVALGGDVAIVVTDSNGASNSLTVALSARPGFSYTTFTLDYAAWPDNSIYKIPQFSAMVAGDQLSENSGLDVGENGVLNTQPADGTYPATWYVRQGVDNWAEGAPGAVEFVIATDDTVPDAFSFADRVDVQLDSVQVSDAVAITGIDGPAPITVAGCEYRIDGGNWTAAAGTVNASEFVELRLTASGAYSTAVVGSVDIGGVTDNWSVTTIAADSTPPVISLVGGDLQLDVGTAFVEPGYSAVDDTDGDITGSVVVSGAVDSNTVGSYTLTYDVSDASGNAAVSVQRVVEIVDTTAPVISLVGGDLQLEVGTAFVEPGYSALDNYDGDVTANVAVSGAVDPNTVGSYTLTYDVSDAAGNAAVSVQRVVTVIDSSAPVITLVGGDLHLFAGTAFVEPGYSAVDNYDGDLTADVTVSGVVDSATAGDYTLTYAVVDAAGNAAVSVQRVVTVEAVDADLEPVDARIYMLPAADDGETTAIYEGNTNYVVVKDVFSVYTLQQLLVDSVTATLLRAGQPIFGPYPLTDTSTGYVLSVPYNLSLTVGESLDLRVEIRGTDGARGDWEIPLEVLEREQ